MADLAQQHPVIEHLDGWTDPVPPAMEPTTICWADEPDSGVDPAA